MSNPLKSRAIAVSAASIAINILLTVTKLLAGMFGHSQALIADAIHSASDVLSTVIVMVALVIARKAPDPTHEYGHQRFESLASLLLALLLGYAGVKIGVTGFTSIVSKEYLTVRAPSFIAAVAALVSIILKEAMYRVTMSVAKAEHSNSLKADAWHHRSDALSSIGSLAGVLFARFGLPIMDPIASLIICVMILKTAVEIAVDSVKALTDSACTPAIEKQLRDTASSVDGVERIDNLKTRIFGAGFYTDIEIAVDGHMTLQQAHAIAEQVHDRIEQTFPNVWHCMVHVNPHTH